jgi:Protein of unknown function (DUF3999)
MSRNQTSRLHALSVFAALPTLCIAAAPRMDDYARGIAIDAADQRPIVQLSVPDVVYQSVVTDDLTDLRVFNADGVPVPHALCAAPTNEAPTISQDSLPVYRLQDVPGAENEGTRVEVQTPSGAQISVQGATGASTGESHTSAYVIDARDVNDALRAMQFDWSSLDGASEVRVSIQASEDLDRWRTIVTGSTLLKVEAGAQQLGRHRIAIPQAHYEYLRVERVDRGPPLQIDGVIAERVTPAPVVEPMWFAATPVAPSELNTLEFDAGRRAPFTYARLTPSQENTSMQVAIESRVEPKATWRVQWTGEVYSILSDTERRVSPPAEFAPTTSRHWRVRLTKTGDTFYQNPALELGYRPANLRFLAQGSGPFTLAYGSRRAEASPARACNSLLGDLNETDLAQSIGEGYAGAARTLGGEDAFRPLPKKTPLRRIVLWTVLVLGVGALVAMALSLLRRVNPDGKT